MKPLSDQGPGLGTPEEVERLAPSHDFLKVVGWLRG
jgi:hypothetical protein